MGSSSCSATERLVRRALDDLESENVELSRMFVGSMHDLAIVVEVDGACFRLAPSGDRVGVTKETSGNVHVRTTLAIGHALVCGETSVVEAVRTGSLEVRGKAAMLERAARAIEVFVHGIVRCRSGGALVEELRLAI